ncbi:hypothetical protein N7468_002863 [Penicillium chermesinum]|uniref:Uncharacterized protein n=1 Tax=Penicillium chermesinum TaxID=63820 RepID=A0A9W9PJE0_9EURO|nr:uncharacterized protein N7468_002863 [Penicillium chermesinum]KAJ5247880.1 hypothetical protein N7468_002863 [Penicillium chermesinum]
MVEGLGFYLLPNDTEHEIEFFDKADPRSKPPLNRGQIKRRLSYFNFNTGTNLRHYPKLYAQYALRFSHAPNNVFEHTFVVSESEGTIETVISISCDSRNVVLGIKVCIRERSIS